MKTRRLTGAVASAALVLGAAGTTAMAAPPDNDDVGMPTVVPGLPFSVNQDTLEATTSPSDPEPLCSGPVGATVWFSYTAVEGDEFVEFNTFGSDYDTVIAVYADEATVDNEVACSDDASEDLTSRATVGAEPGVTYLVMVGSYEGTPGGSLSFQADVGQPPLEITVSVDPRGTVASKTGVATIRGTVTCSQPTTLGIEASLKQRAGRLFIFGYGFSEVECDESASWSVTVDEANGRFAGGRAEAQVTAFDFQSDTFATDEQTVRLSGKRAKR